MIKNIVFNFGNVIVKWDIDSIFEKYAINDVESKMLKEIIFESEEWLQLDEGIISAEQAEKIFQGKAPDSLKKQQKYLFLHSTTQRKKQLRKR